MSSSNIGARRNRNIRDHLFVINGILNDVQQNRNKPGVDVGVYDIPINVFIKCGTQKQGRIFSRLVFKMTNFY